MNPESDKPGIDAGRDEPEAENPAEAAAILSRGKRKKTADIKTLLAVGMGAIILILAVVVTLDIEDITREYVEGLASRTLGVPVHIGELSLEPKEQRITVSRVLVENPKGFTKPAALSIDALNIDVQSLEANRLIIRQIEVTQPALLLEARNNQLNLATIRANMDRQAAVETETRENAPPIDVAIGQIDIQAANLYMTINGSELEPVPLPPFRITGIGGESGTVLSSEAIAQVMDHITRQAVAKALEGGFLDYALTPQALEALKINLGLTYVSRARRMIEGLRDKAGNLLEAQPR